MEKMDSTIAEFLRTRLSSAAVAAYGFFWLLMHAQGVYTTFFVSQDFIYKKYGLLKNEYVYKYFFGYRTVPIFAYAHTHHVYLVEWRSLWGLILPAILTYAYIWLLPKHVLIRAYQEEQRHKTAKKMFKFEQEQEVIKFEKETAEQKTDAVEAEITLAKKEKQAAELDPQIAWAKEYEEFEKDPAFQGFSTIINAYYDHSGNAKPYYDNNVGQVQFEVPSGMLAIADSNGLITLDTKTNTFGLTPKGRYFVKRFPSGR